MVISLFSLFACLHVLLQFDNPVTETQVAAPAAVTAAADQDEQEDRKHTDDANVGDVNKRTGRDGGLVVKETMNKEQNTQTAKK